jgi:ATP-binding cassette subfamily B protein
MQDTQTFTKSQSLRPPGAGFFLTSAGRHAIMRGMPAYPKTLFKYYIKNFWRFCGGTLIVWGILFIAHNSGVNVVRPLITKNFVSIIEAGGPGMLRDGFRLCAAFCALFVFFNILLSVERVLSRRAKARAEQTASADLYEYLYSQTAAFYADRLPGKMANQIGLIAGGFISSLEKIIELTGILFTLALNLGMVFAINWKIAMILVAGMILRFAWCAIAARPMFRASKKLSEQRSSLSGKLIDSISNFMTVKLFAAAGAEIAAAKPDREKTARAVIESRYKSFKFWIVPAFIEDILLCVAIFAVIFMNQAENLTVAEAVFSITIYNQISRMIWELVWHTPDALDSYGMAAESYAMLIKPVAVKDDENAPDLIVDKGAVKIKNVSFDYGGKKGDILRDFSLNIAPGEKIGLIGLSGSGKTTLANLLMRLYDPRAGKIEIDGQNIRRVSQDSLRRRIAFIPQDSVLFHRSLEENIGYGKQGASHAEIVAAAKKAGAHEFIMNAPKKYATLVGDRGIKLSGGQRQRIAIARAIIKNAPILIMDEATSALDSETERIIQTSFGEVSRGKTTIAIAHRLSTLRHMDRIVVMSKGKIVESGTHGQLLKKNGQYSRLWKLQSAGFLMQE